MGVDISGRNPVLRGSRPQRPDWNNVTEIEKKNYYEALQSWESLNPGYYFRANWWSWRPICYLIEIVSREKSLEIDTSSYGFNDGAGLEDQESCNRLADSLQDILDASENLQEDSDSIYLVLGSWCSLDHTFIDREFIEKHLSKLPQPFSVLYAPIVLDDGTILVPSHSTSKGQLQEFINFLRECGGFEIW